MSERHACIESDLVSVCIRKRSVPDVVFAALCGQFDLLLSVSASALASPHVNQAM